MDILKNIFWWSRQDGLAKWYWSGSVASYIVFVSNFYATKWHMNMSTVVMLIINIIVMWEGIIRFSQWMAHQHPHSDWQRFTIVARPMLLSHMLLLGLAYLVFGSMPPMWALVLVAVAVVVGILNTCKL